MIFDIGGNNISDFTGHEVFCVDPFVSDDTQTLVSTFSGVIALYDALVTAYPDYVTKTTLTSGSFTNYEYAFKTGNYNSYATHAYNMDSATTKPKFLVVAGIHGYERTSVMANYVFFKALCEGKAGLKYVREAVEFRTIPVCNPYGYDHDSRYNSNGVDLNRNFDSDWIAQSSPYYSGASAASEDETKVIQEWLTTNADAFAFLDHHNSEVVNEICLVQSIGTAYEAVELKENALQCANHIITHWKLDRELPSSSVFFYTGVDNNSKGFMSHYARDRGINSFIMETSWNVNSTGKHSNATIGVSAEAQAISILGMCSYIDQSVFS